MFSIASKFYNKEKAEKERIEKEVKAEIKKQKDDYFAKLKNDKKFQEYVIDGIFRHYIDNLSDITKVPVTDNLRDEVMARRITVDTLRKMLQNML